jgi:DNA-binding NarL/FixJ family response regulator
MANRSRIAIVEDHALLAETVGLALGAEGLDVTVADLSDTAAALSSANAGNDTVVLLDLELGPPIHDGTKLVAPLTAAGASVIVVSGVGDRVRVAAALEAGAIGYVPKDTPFGDLLDTVLLASRGENVFDDNARHAMLADLRTHRAARQRVVAPFEQLTPRERAVLGELCAGNSVETIATEWVVSTATVRTQVRGVLTKLDVNSQLAAVAKARAAGWPVAFGAPREPSRK